MNPPFAQLVIAKDFSVRRSELTCPAHSLKMMTKAAGSGADEVIFDLEDACAVSQKIEARKTLVDALKSLSFGKTVRAFRPNSLRTKYFYRDVIDVLENAGSFVDVVVLPKVESASDVVFADRLITQIEQNMGWELGRIRLEILIESAKAVLHAEEIALSSKRVASLIFGVADYAGDIGARDFAADSDRTFLFARSQIVAAARSAGVDAIDAVTVQFKDLAQVRKDSEAGARLGFDGKWAIHPSHVEVIHQVYTPSKGELEHALRVLKAYEQADAQGQGAIVLDDEMVDAASLRVEWKKLAVGKKAGLVNDQHQLI
jgi:citrate lyase subunit beta/citryl-CoA lyase